MKKTSTWYTPRVEYRGRITMRIADSDNYVMGSARLWWKDDGSTEAVVQIRAATKGYAWTDLTRAAIGLRFTEVSINTRKGTLHCHQVRGRGVALGNGLRIFLGIGSAQLEAVDALPAAFWVLPLINYVGPLAEPLPADHPLLMNHPSFGGARITIADRPAIIQPLPGNVTQRNIQRLKKGTQRTLTTAVMVGELDGTIPPLESIKMQFDDGILPILSLASGVEITAPWIEFRASDGSLVRRAHFRWTCHAYVPGHACITNSNPEDLDVLVRAAQSSPHFGDTWWYTVIRHIVNAGWDRFMTLEQMCYRCCVAIEAIAKDRGIGAQNLMHNLSTAEQPYVKSIIDTAQKAVTARKKRARGTNDEQVLDSIASRLGNVANKDGDFATILTTLLQHPDVRLADALAFGNSTLKGSGKRWQQGMSIVRNAVAHNTSFAEESRNTGIDEDLDIPPLVLHLHDLALRIVFRIIGYSGRYYSPLHFGLRSYPVDHVTASTTLDNLGYDMPIS